MNLVLAQNGRGKYYFPLNCPEICKTWTVSARIVYATWLPTVAEKFTGGSYEAYAHLQKALAKGKYPVLDIGQGQYLFYPKAESECSEAVSEYIYSFSERTAKVQIKSFDLQNKFWQIQNANNGLWGLKEVIVCGIPDEYGCIKFHSYEGCPQFTEEEYETANDYIEKWSV